MKLARTAFYLTISMAISGFVHAESASLYTQVRKSLHHTHRSASTSTSSQQASAKPEMQPIDTILPAGTRVVAGDDEEFYILTQDQPDPLTRIDIQAAQVHEAVMSEEQLKRMDDGKQLISFNQTPHVDAILSQIANKSFKPSSDSESRKAFTTESTKPLTTVVDRSSATKIFKKDSSATSVAPAKSKVVAENFVKDDSQIVDYKVALDSVFAQVEKAEADEHLNAVSIQAAKSSSKHHAVAQVAHHKTLAIHEASHHVAPVTTNATHHAVSKSAPFTTIASHHAVNKLAPTATIASHQTSKVAVKRANIKAPLTAALQPHRLAMKAKQPNKVSAPTMHMVAVSKKSHPHTASATPKSTLAKSHHVAVASIHSSKHIVTPMVKVVKPTVAHKSLSSHHVTKVAALKTIPSKKPVIDSKHSGHGVASKSSSSKLIASAEGSHTHTKS